MKTNKTIISKAKGGKLYLTDNPKWRYLTKENTNKFQKEFAKFKKLDTI